MVSESKKVAWNASQGLIMEISNRRSLANTYFIKSDMRKAFNTLTSIKQSVIQSLHNDERKKLNEMEENFTKISPALSIRLSNSFNPESKKLFSLAYNIAKKLYSNYNDYLMDLLDDRGYLIGEQTDSSKMSF